MPDNTVEVKITGDASGVKTAMRDAAGAVKEGASDMSSGLGGVGGAIQEFKDQLSSIASSTGFTAITELAQQIREVGRAAFELTERATDIANMSEVLQVSTDQFQVLGLAAEEAGVGQEKLFRGTERLIKLMEDARKGTGSAVEQLRELGFTTSQIGDKSFGTAQILETLRDRLNNAATATDTMQALTQTLGARAALLAIAIKALPPDLHNLADAMNEISGLSNTQIDQAKEMHGAWSRLGTLWTNFTTKALVGLSSSFLSITGIGEAFAPATKALTGLGAAATAAAAQSGAAHSLMVQHAHEITKAELDALQDRIAAEKQGSAQRLALVRQFYTEAKKFYGSDEVDAVRAAHRAIIAEEQAYEAEILRRKQAALASIKAVTADELADVRLKTAATDKMLKDIVDLEKNAVDAQQKDASLSLSIEQARIQKLYDANLIGIGQKKLLEQKALTDEYNQEVAALVKLRSLHTGELADQTKIDSQLLLLAKKYHADVDKLETASDLRRKTFLASLNQGLGGTLSNFLKGAQTIGDTIRGLMSSVLDSITNMLADLATEWLTQHVAMAFATKTAAATSAGAYSGVAGAAGIASFAGAPWPVDLGAPAFGATMAAAAASYSAAAFAASAGFDIPAGMNPVTQLHQKEMVLPAHLAEPMRQFLTGGRAGGSPVHLHVNAVDARSVQKLFNRHGSALADSLRRQERRFRGHAR